MILKRILQAGCLALVATTALAHEGVKNPAVAARMHAMADIGREAKLLGQMSKREIPFDRGAAREASAEIGRRAGEIGALFAVEATDPKSEALPVIWRNFDAFRAEAESLRLAARAAALGIDAQEDLSGALTGIGKACGSCHQTYRK